MATSVASRSPATAGAAKPAPTTKYTREQLVGAVAARIEPVKVGPVYQLGLLVVAVTMLVLPVIYVALIAAAAYLLYLHAVNGLALFAHARGGGAMKLAFLAYAGPLVAGAVLLFFMVKPLFARKVERDIPVTLRPEDEPVLFAFVERLAAAVGAPKPVRIDVDCQVNASASFREGWRGFAGGDLVLTIGLPLAAGLTLREMAGVLAHEFGHFAQGTGMRLTYVIRVVNGWFARVVYERDQWDEQLLAAQQADNWALQLFVGLARLMVWLTRKILWMLMVVGHGISAFMLRQMEFDADRYEARVAGVDAFAATTEKLATLGLGMHAALSDLGDAWRERRLCDDLPALVRNREATIPAELRTLVVAKHAQAKTGWFDTHPAAAARVASARREGAAGVVKVDAPAAALFADFAKLSRVTTLIHYRQMLGAAVKVDNLVSTDSLARQREESSQKGEALGRYFQGLVQPVRPVFFAAEGLPTDVDGDAAAEQLLEARSQLAAALPQARAAAKAFDEADEVLIGAARAKALLAAGVKRLKPADFKLARVDDAAVTTATREARAKRDAARRSLDAVLALSMRRMRLAVHLASPPPAPAKPAAAASNDEDFGEYDLVDAPATSTTGGGGGNTLVDALRALSAVSEGAERVRMLFYAGGALLAQVREGQNPQPLVDEVLAVTRKLVRELSAMHAGLRTARYPYEHAERDMTIARFALQVVPPEDAVGDVYRAAEAMLDAYYGLYARLMADLAARAEAAEAELGLPPLEAVAEEKAAEPATAKA